MFRFYSINLSPFMIVWSILFIHFNFISHCVWDVPQFLD